MQLPVDCTKDMTDSRFAPSQWETALLYKDVFHKLGVGLQSVLIDQMHWPQEVFPLTNYDKRLSQPHIGYQLLPRFK